MIFDPLSAVIVVGAIGISGLLKSKDDVIVKYIEKTFISDVEESHRIVITSPSVMKINETTEITRTL